MQWWRLIAAVLLATLAAGCSGNTGDAAPGTAQDDPRASDLDRRMIARTYELARSAATTGNPPFGALLARGDSIVAEAFNSGKSTGDVTKHAELSLISEASRRFGREYLAGCSLYSSTEPCVMCSGAIRWAGIARVVYGTPQNLDGWFQEIPCREILAKIAPQIDVVGPVLQEEGRKIRSGFRGKRGT